MTVDVCNIVKETARTVSIDDYGLNCATKVSTLLISHYMEQIKCCPCEDVPPKCATSSIEVCDNSELKPACCNLCIYPNEQFPEEACAVSILPDNTIPNVKIISPNNESQCQE